MLRVDVRYTKPGNYMEVGLVDHDLDEEPKNPTLFLGAFCNTDEDRKWFDQQVEKLTKAS